MRKGARLRRVADAAVPPGLPDTPVGPDPVELAWAAGFFDGEGSTFLVRKYVAVGISQSSLGTDCPSVLLRFKAAVGGIGHVGGPFRLKNAKHKLKWIYRAHGLEMAQAVIAMIWPWLGIVKRDQARSALASSVAVLGGSRYRGVRFGRPIALQCKRGHSYDDAYVSGHQRTCRSCARERYTAKRSSLARSTSSPSPDPAGT